MQCNGLSAIQPQNHPLDSTKTLNKESYRVRPPSSHKVSEAGLGEVEPAPFPDLLREADRGRFAAAPASIPAKGRRDVFWRVAYNVIDDRVLPLAGGVAYYALLAVFPAVAMTVSLYGLFADASTVSRHLVLLSDILPPGSADLLAQQMTRIAGQSANTLGIAFLTSLLISLWSANAGMSALFDALNVVYKEKEKRRSGDFTPPPCCSRSWQWFSLRSRSPPSLLFRWCSTSSAGAVTASACWPCCGGRGCFS
jgi:Virulence factor BrkB